MLRSLISKLVSPHGDERPGTPPTGDLARAVVTYYHGDIEAGLKQKYFWKNVTVRLADDPEDGPTTKVATYLQRRPHALMRIGTNIPVRVKPGTRTITAIDADAFEAEALANDPDA